MFIFRENVGVREILEILRQVSGIRYLNQVSTFQLACADNEITYIGRLLDSSSQTRILSKYLS